MKSKLTFSTLRLANETRLPGFKNSKGELAHNTTGSDWSPLEWGAAMGGEVGEVIEVVLEFAKRATKIGDTLKKIRRGDLDPTLVEIRERVAKELADVQIYLDLLAMQLGIDLGAATVQKFNEVSRRVGVGVFIICDDSDAPGSCPLCDDEGVSPPEPPPAQHRPTDSGEFPLAPGYSDDQIYGRHG